MTYTVTCPRCGHTSQRHTSSEHKPVCRHEHHAPSECVCGNCRTGWQPDAVTDASGRLIAPPQPTTPERPSGPWDDNRPC